MTKKIMLSLCLILIMLGSRATLAADQDILQSPLWQEKTSVEMIDMPVGVALEFIMKPTGSDFSIDPDVRFIKISSLALKDVPRYIALKNLVKAAGLEYRIENNTIIVGNKPGVANPWSKHVSVHAENVPLNNVLQEMFKSVDLNFALDSGAQNLMVHSVNLTDITFAEALDKVLSDAGAMYSRTLYYVAILPKLSSTAHDGSVNSEVKNDIPVQVTVIQGTSDEDPWLKHMNIVVSKDTLWGSLFIKIFRSIGGLNFSIDRYTTRKVVGPLNLANVTLSEALDKLSSDGNWTYTNKNGIIMITSPHPSLDKLVNLEVKDMPFVDVMALLFRDTGIDYSIDQDIQRLRVTAMLKGVPFQDAFDSVIRATGLDYEIDKYCFHIFRRSDVTATPTQEPVSPGVSSAVNSGVQPDAATSEISMQVKIEAEYPSGGASKRSLTGPITMIAYDKQIANVSVSAETPPMPDGKKKTISLVSISITPTILNNGRINIKGTMDYIVADYFARNIKIYAIIDAGKLQKLPAINIRSATGKANASVDVLIKAVLLAKK